MRFEIYRDSAGGFRWRLVCDNGRITGDSGESYSRKRDVLRAIRGVKRGVVLARVVQA